MADFHKDKLYRPPNPRLANLLLVGLVILTFTFCLLLYTGMISTRKSLDVLAENQLVSSEVLVELNKNYERERTLNLVLIVVTASMGLIFIVFYRYLLRVSTSLREIQTIDHDILNSITRGILTANLQGEITSCNRALEQILELRGAKLIGRFLEEAFRNEDPLYQLLKESLQGEDRAQERDLEYKVKTGKILNLRLTTFALKNEVGKRVGGILLVKDMTEIHKMEERMQRTSRLAALGQLTQRLVHEIRNPLSAMDINIQLLQERSNEGSEDP
jgi:PAS domain S-box-containing protein